MTVLWVSVFQMEVISPMVIMYDTYFFPPKFFLTYHVIVADCKEENDRLVNLLPISSLRNHSRNKPHRLCWPGCPGQDLQAPSHYLRGLRLPT